MRPMWMSLVIVSSLLAPAAQGQLKVLDAWYRPDRAFPQYKQFWTENAAEIGGPEINDEGVADAEGKKLGGSVHLAIRNDSKSAITPGDVLLDGIGLKNALVYSGQRNRKKFASIDFSKLAKPDLDKLMSAGEPIWWKIDPPTIAPGGSAEVVVRLRFHPKAGKVALRVDAGAQSVTATVAHQQRPVIRSITFNTARNRVYLYASNVKGATLRGVAIDGAPVSQSVILADPAMSLAAIELTLSKPLELASFHTYQVAYSDGSLATAGLRTFAPDMMYGMFGGGKGNTFEQGKAYVQDLISRCINTQMPQIGSAAAQEFYRSPQGQKFCKEAGFGFCMLDPGKMGIDDPELLYVHDEPDAGDYKMEGVPNTRKIGGLGMYCLGRATDLRKAAPRIPQMLNLDSTYKPQNWYVYGQLADFLATDPYYQNRLMSAYLQKPQRIPIYNKATYLYAVASTAESACYPRPMHVILFSADHRPAGGKPGFRAATPEEKRIELYFALAAGAKHFSYWWYTPGAKSNGVGDWPANPRAARLWDEIGRLGAEVRTAAPLVLNSCPVELPSRTSSPNLWVRTLLVGKDSVILLAVNNDHHNDDKGTTFKPIENATVSVHLPFQASDAFEISSDGVLPARVRGGAEATVDLGRLDIARMIVLTRDKSVREQISSRYQNQFASRVAAIKANPAAGAARNRSEKRP